MTTATSVVSQACDRSHSYCLQVCITRLIRIPVTTVSYATKYGGKEFPTLKSPGVVKSNLNGQSAQELFDVTFTYIRNLR